MLLRQQVAVAVHGDLNARVAGLADHVLQVLALLDQHGGKEVAEGVRRHVPKARGRQGGLPDPLPELVRIAGPPVPVAEEPQGRRLDRPGLGLPRPEPAQHVEELVAEVNGPLAPLRLRHVLASSSAVYGLRLIISPLRF